jgi:predicted amidohydrolase
MACDDAMRIAAAQTAPVWGDAEATTSVVVDWIGWAADADVDLLAFGETFLSGYPFWISITDGADSMLPTRKRPTPTISRVPRHKAEECKRGEK